MTQSRQLAAIMFTDIVGYTSMMGSDETKAVAVIKHYNATLEKWVTHFHGQIINYYGDGSLCIFSSVTDAVKCAIEVQAELKSEPVVPLRIGLHVGEVFFEDAKALGDGVNVASRIQSLGQASTILFSKEIFDKIKNQPEFKSISLGKFEFKNVDEPMEAFALTNEGLSVPKRGDMEGKLKSQPSSFRWPSLSKSMIAGTVALILLIIGFYSRGIFFKSTSLSEKENSLAVLYFDNMSQDKDQEYFSDGITEEIIAHIAKIKDIRVISRTSVLPYKGKPVNLKQIAKELNVTSILEGSVRKSGNNLRITAQLIDATTDQHIWAETYDRELKDIFEVQSEIARMIAQKFKIEITPEADKKISRIPTKNIEAYEQFQKGYFFMYKKYYNTHQDADFEKSKQFFEKAVQLDSNYAEAYAGLAEVYDELRNKNQDSFPRELLELKEKLARKALQLNPNSSFVNTAMAWAIQHRTNPDFDSSYYYLKKAYILDPRNPLTNINLVYLLSNQLGLHEISVPFILNAIKVDPLDPNHYAALGYNYQSLGLNTEAKTAFLKCIELNSDKFNGEYLLLSGLIYYGEYEKAEKILSRNATDYLVLKSALHAAMGEYSKIDSAHRNFTLILLLTNRNKILPEIITRLDKNLENRKLGDRFENINYDVLKNSIYWKQYQADPDFKKILAKAKKLHDTYLEKYGVIELLD
jgi:adenylate cyclase